MHRPVCAFDALEVTVIALAHGERGRGVPPRGMIARAFRKVLDLLHPDGRLRRLADPRLEALRLFVNATYRKGGVRRHELTEFLASGFSASQLRLLLGNTILPA